MIRLSLSAVFWLLWIGAFLVHEFYALANPSDNWIPLTHVLREAVAHSYWFRLALHGLLFWLFFHFGGPAVIHETVRKLAGRWVR